MNSGIPSKYMLAFKFVYSICAHIFWICTYLRVS